MKIFCILIFIFLYQINCAQIGSNVSSRYRVSLYGTYQSWGTPDNGSLSQFSNQLNVKYKVQPHTTVSFNSWFAASDASSQSLSGISDAQLQVSHKLKKHNTQLEFGINLPTGNESLNEDESNSVILLSRDLFNFNIPVLGLGTNIFFGATWADEVSDDVVLGFGFSYQLKGAYSPLNDNESEYEPSNEFLLTSGIDYRIDPTKSISGDVIALFYGRDRFDGTEIFSAGNRFVFNISYRQFISNNTFRLNVRYRYSADDEIKSRLAFISQKVNSNYFILSSSFNHKINIDLALHYLIEVRFFEETAAPFSGFTSFGFGGGLSYLVSPQVEIPFRLKLTFGSQADESLTGFEVGAGVNIAL